MVLKHRPWRTTEVEAGTDPVFVKRFHDARFPWAALGRFRDLRRARREARLLAELGQAGLPVPAVLGITETTAGVELRLEYLTGARPVEELLDDSSGVLARSLGKLLARLHAAGFAHGDLHPGNVVVDARGKTWIVDAAAIRRGSSSARAHDLVAAAAAARERTTPRFRARFLLAYLRGSESARRGEAASLGAAIEGAARVARRERVRAECDRWSRDSGVCARHVDGELVVIAPRALARTEAIGLARCALYEAAGSALDGAKGSALDGGAGSARERVGLTARDIVRGRSAGAVWRDLARLHEQRVPAARPLVLIEAPVVLAVFESPANGRAPARASTDDCRAVGTLAGTLWDRGLALRRLDIRIDERCVAFAAAGSGLAAASTFEHAQRAWAGRDGATSWISSPDFQAAFLAAQRGSRAQREALRDRLASADGSHGAARPG